MVPVWAAVLGVIGTLAGVWVTQVATTRREVSRDVLRWAQERQQREFDTQKAAFSEALLALNKWHYSLRDLAAHVGFPELPKPNMETFPELKDRAEHSYTAIDLFCSDAAASMTKDALASLSALSLRIHEAAANAETIRDPITGRTGAYLGSQGTSDVLNRLRDVYRAELADMSALPLTMSGPNPRSN